MNHQGLAAAGYLPLNPTVSPEAPPVVSPSPGPCHGPMPGAETCWVLGLGFFFSNLFFNFCFPWI